MDFAVSDGRQSGSKRKQTLTNISTNPKTLKICG